jgi:hypothetical protein
MKNTLLFLSILLVSTDAYYVKKHIPEHILNTIVDPKIKKPTKKHNITADQLTGQVFEPWKKKTEEDVPRVKDEYIHEEDIDHDDIYIDPNHIKDA